MYPTKEEAKEIALQTILKNITVYKVTDDASKLNCRVYGLPPGCWYITYRNSIHKNNMLESSNLIAVSKVDGRVLYDDSCNDEG